MELAILSREVSTWHETLEAFARGLVGYLRPGGEAKATAEEPRASDEGVVTATQQLQVPKCRGIRSQILYLSWILLPYAMIFKYLDP